MKGNELLYELSGDGTYYIVTGVGDLAGNIEIPDEWNGKPVKEIVTGAFKHCNYLKSVIIPDSVTSIGKWVFEDCSGLTSVTIGNGVTEIGELAFCDCSGLTSVTIPESVTSIGDRAFANCSGLKKITVAKGNPVYKSEENCIIEKETNTLVLGCRSSKIPDSVTTIGGRAFWGCSGLTGELTIPDSVTTIGERAFSGCSGLTSVTIPKSVTEIGICAFV